MPWEFKFLRFEPDLWEPEDVVRLHTHAIVGNLSSEVERAFFVRDFGFRYEDIRSPLDAGWQTEVPDGLDLGDLPEDPDELMAVYDLPPSGSASTRPTWPGSAASAPRRSAGER